MVRSWGPEPPALEAEGRLLVRMTKDPFQEVDLEISISRNVLRARDHYYASSYEGNCFRPPSDWPIPGLDQIRMLCPDTTNVFSRHGAAGKAHGALGQGTVIVGPLLAPFGSILLRYGSPGPHLPPIWVPQCPFLHPFGSLFQPF